MALLFRGSSPRPPARSEKMCVWTVLFLFVTAGRDRDHLGARVGEVSVSAPQKMEGTRKGSQWMG